MTFGKTTNALTWLSYLPKTFAKVISTLAIEETNHLIAPIVSLTYNRGYCSDSSNKWFVEPTGLEPVTLDDEAPALTNWATEPFIYTIVYIYIKQFEALTIVAHYTQGAFTGMVEPYICKTGINLSQPSPFGCVLLIVYMIKKKSCD